MRQCASRVLLIRPAAFGFNPETAATNRMQTDAPSDARAAHERALGEFDAFVAALRGEGADVYVAQDALEPPKPDAIFPNNWVSFHADGTVVLYPMQPESRRSERRADVVSSAAAHFGYEIRRTLDLTPHEREGRFLEGTGSLVLDHVGRIAYACRSPRTDEGLVRAWCESLGYEPVVFDARDASGMPYYHTNVMMSIGERYALVASETIRAPERPIVLESLARSGRELIEIDASAVARFAGNVLELASWDEALGDCRVLVMSTTARSAFSAEQFARLSACTDSVLVAPVPTIEALGGGGVRCMLAEVHEA